MFVYVIKIKRKKRNWKMLIWSKIIVYFCYIHLYIHIHFFLIIYYVQKSILIIEKKNLMYLTGITNTYF